MSDSLRLIGLKFAMPTTTVSSSPPRIKANHQRVRSMIWTIATAEQQRALRLRR